MHSDEHFIGFNNSCMIVERRQPCCQKGLFLERVLISPRTEKALAAAVTKLIAPMAREACGAQRNGLWIIKPTGSKHSFYIAHQ